MNQLNMKRITTGEYISDPIPGFGQIEISCTESNEWFVSRYVGNNRRDRLESGCRIFIDIVNTLRDAYKTAWAYITSESSDVTIPFDARIGWKQSLTI